MRFPARCAEDAFEQQTSIPGETRGIGRTRCGGRGLLDIAHSSDRMPLLDVPLLDGDNRPGVLAQKKPPQVGQEPEEADLPGLASRPIY